MITTSKLEPLYRISDGRTLFEKVTCGTDPKMSSVSVLWAKMHTLDPMAYLSTGRTVLEHCAGIKFKELLAAMVEYCGLQAMDRIPDGKTVFECFILCGASDVAELLIRTRAISNQPQEERGCEARPVDPTSIASTGHTLFEVAIDSKAFAVANALVTTGSTVANFDPLYR